MLKLRFSKFYCSIKGENKCKASDFQGPVFTEASFLYQQHRCKLKRKIISACSILTRTPNTPLGQHLNTLVVLNLRDCKSLKSLPAGIHLEFLKELDLLNGTAIEELPSAIECLYKLLHLDLEYCESLNSLPSGLCKLKLLNYLTLNCCSNLQRLPDELGNLEALWSLHAIGTAI
ncbi:hypothetical protein WN943_015552 [Citrus x changshan-huyou]